MAYEVTKTIAGRAYRYQVESIRDPQTGKRRNRWTYLGRVGAEASRPPTPRPRGDARERLLDALERLLASRDYEDVTADAIAVEAGLAHGTFYRHFRDKRDALRGALLRVREQARLGFDRLRDDVTDPAQARAQIRALADGLQTPAAAHPALLRAYQLVALRDEVLVRERRAYRDEAVARLAAHLSALHERGLADVRAPEATAGVLLALLQGLIREAILDGIVADEARRTAAADVLERAVFPDPTRKVVTS